jgi:hypothetical protein
MPTSKKISSLSKPDRDERIPLGTLGYFRARNRYRIHDVVLKAFAKSGISQATLARRLGKKPDVICRWLGAPGNWTLDTVSDLLFAISGTEPNYSLSSPLDEGTRNYVGPDWLVSTDVTSAITVQPRLTELAA